MGVLVEGIKAQRGDSTVIHSVPRQIFIEHLIYTRNCAGLYSVTVETKTVVEPTV